MIGAINFLGNIQTNYGEKRASNPALKPMEHDCFVKSTEGEKAKTLREAKEKIINKIATSKQKKDRTPTTRNTFFFFEINNLVLFFIPLTYLLCNNIWII